MRSDRCVTRRNKLIQLLRKADVSTLLVTSPLNVSYLTGFTGEDSFLIIGPKVTRIVSDTRFETQLQQECPDVDAEIRTSRTSVPDFLGNILSKLSLTSLAIESSTTTLDLYQSLVEKLKTVRLVPTSGSVESLRQCKDSSEIEEMRSAIRQAEKGFELMRTSILVDQTERQAAFDLEHSMRRFGALRAAFSPIIAVGDRSALPHYRAGSNRFSDADFFLIDWGAVSSGGYHSDLTRVLVTSKLPPKLAQVYGVVLRAQLAGIQAIRPGIKCQEVDAAARKIIDQAGYGKYFGHGLGHGIGLEIHESPRLNPISTDVLKPGMIVTVEPGIYLPGVGGIRIEDDVLVTRDGCEVLTSLPKEFPECVN